MATTYYMLVFSLSYSEGNPNKVKPFQCDEARDLVIQGEKKLKRKKGESFVLTKVIMKQLEENLYKGL